MCANNIEIIITALLRIVCRAYTPKKSCSILYRAQLFGRTVARASLIAHAANPHQRPTDLF